MEIGPLTHWIWNLGVWPPNTHLYLYYTQAIFINSPYISINFPHIGEIYSDQLTQKPHVFGKWEVTGVSMEIHGENMQITLKQLWRPRFVLKAD